MNQPYLKNILSAKFDFEIWKDLLENIFPKVEFFTSVAKITDSHVKDGGHVGNIRLDDGRSLAIFRFEVADNVQISRNRKSLRDIAAKYVDQSLIHGALVFYYSQNQDDYRLTFIAKQTYFNESGELVKKETAPKRYTFLLGKNEPCTTAASRLKELADKKSYGSIYLTDVTEAFSVERLNKEFFNGYKAQYKKFVDTLSDTKSHRDYVKKLLGRLVFLQFLQKKGWMGVPASNSKWEGGDKNYLSKLVDNYANNDHLLSDILEPLFFRTLNEKRNDDIADCKLGENIRIPYLNGGLFDKDKIDELDIDFPYAYFKELMDFFSQYNFTIDENDPDDSEVGIDPEMLGHIFENLLEDNKDKGAFYTPKEIVQYMCRQSVIQYLKTHEPAEQYAEPIEQLINDGVVSPILQNKNSAIRFTQLLKEVKVCDPAIGSGAFPMGILYVLYHAIHHLHSHAEPHGNFDSTQTKRDIIQNNIFGVDIEQGAVDIARLRFWLALVVDADEPQPLPNLDYKITCGNSLLSRYPIDALIENVFVEYNKGKKEDEKMTLAKYKELVSDYTNTSNHQTKNLFRTTIEEIKKAFKVELSKQDIMDVVKIKKQINDIETPNLFGEELNNAQKNKLKKLKKELEQKEEEKADILNNKIYENAFEWRFEFPQLLDDNGKFTGFDIVIGNPPYGAKLSDAEKKIFKEKFSDVHMRTPETFCYFTSMAFRLSSKTRHGIVAYIVPNNIFFQNENEKTRILLAIDNTLLRAINLGDNTFEEADVPTCIFIAKQEKLDNYNIAYSDYRNDNVKNIEWQKCIEEIDIAKLLTIPSLVIGLSNSDIDILNTIKNNGVTIDSIADEMASGISTGGDKIFKITYDTTKDFNLENNIIKKVLVGSDIDKYSINYKNDYLIYTTRETEIQEYPYAQVYLDQYKNKLMQRSESRQGILPWYALGRNRYPLLFEEPKIVMRQTADSIRCVYDENKFYVLNSILVFKKNTGQYDYKYIAPVLNSKLCNYLYKRLTQEEGRTFAEVKPANVRKLYIPKATEKEQHLMSLLYNYMEYLRNTESLQIDNSISNQFMGDFFERIIDGCVFELFFKEHMVERGINIIDYLYGFIAPIDDNIEKAIAKSFDALYKTNNEVRTRLELFVSRSPEYLKTIIQS
jgi:hypothetical protein